MAEIGELVSFMARVAPRELEVLQKQFPGDIYFQRGGVLGDGPNHKGCQAALPALSKVCEAAALLRPKLHKRLQWSWRFDLLSKFAAAAGSSGACGAIIAGAEISKALLPAVLALVGSLSALIFSYLQRDVSSQSVPEAYNRLISALVVAGELTQRLPALCEGEATEELDQALKQANETARTLNELLLRYE